MSDKVRDADGWKLDKMAEAIQSSVIANWSSDMGDGYGGFNALKVASEVIEKLYWANIKPSDFTFPVVDRTEALEALTPSGETKAAYIGEFGFNHVFTDDDGIERTRYLQVPWTTIKEIMKAIMARALAAPATGEKE